MAATMCELGNSTVAKAKEAIESQEDTIQGLLLAATRVKTMPARPAIERSSIAPRVVVVDNFQGIFQLVGPKEKVFVPRRVLLDSGTQPLMLGTSAIERLGLTADALEKCPWTGITRTELSLKLHQNYIEDAGFMKVKAIVTKTKSYDVLVGSMVLYPVGFTLDF
jgi:hypothetical protein